MTERDKTRVVTASLVAITGLGLVVRLPGLRDWWLNPDEGIYLSIAIDPSWPRFWGEVASNAHPPLYYLLLRGVAGIDPDFQVLRLPSLAFGLMAIPALWFATRELLGPTRGRWVGLVAALLVALSPGAMVQSVVIRPYTAQLVVLALAVAFLARYASRHARADVFAWGSLLLVAVLLHYGSSVVFASCMASIGVLVAAGRLAPRHATELCVATLPAVAALATAAVVHLSSAEVRDELLQVARSGWLAPYFHRDLAGFAEGFVGVMRVGFGERYDAIAGLMLGVGLAAAFARRQLLLVSLVLLALATAATLSFLELLPLGETRHSLYLLAVLIPCIANGIDFLLLGSAPRHLLAGAALLLLFAFPQPLRSLLGTAVLPSRALAEQVTPRAVVERASSTLEGLSAAPGIVLMDEQTFYTLTPLFGPKPLDRRRVEPVPPGGAGRENSGAWHFRWGAADVIVSPLWRLRADSHLIESSEHVLAFLRQADRAFRELAIAERRDVTLLFAGWGARSYAPLAYIDPRRGAGCVLSHQLDRGLGWARLDPSQCLRIAGSRRGTAQ